MRHTQSKSAATLKLPWRRGPEWTLSGTVLISITNFEVARFRDLPGVYLAAMRLGQAWPTMNGAVGLLFWARPWERRSGAISVWRTEADLRRFVSWPVHVAVMRKYRQRATVTTDSWNAERFGASEVKRQAGQWRLLPDPPAGAEASHS